MIDLVYSLLIAHGAKSSVPAKQLAPAIVKLSKKYGEDPILVTQIILLESRGKANAHNTKTKDYGLMQINEKTILAKHLDMSRIFNWRYNLEAGVRILSELRKKDRFRPCMWNIGVVGSKKYPRVCERYERKLSTIGGFI